MKSLVEALAQVAFDFLVFLVIITVSALFSIGIYLWIAIAIEFFFHTKFDASPLGQTMSLGIVTLGAIMLTCAFYIKHAINSRL